MTNFRAERQWALLDASARLAYALNIMDAGDAVSVVTVPVAEIEYELAPVGAVA